MHRVVNLAHQSSQPDRAVIATDAHGRIVYWDDGAVRLYGWTGEEVLGRPVVEVTPTELTRTQAGQIMAALGSGRSWSGEFTVRARDGRRFEASVTDIPVRDDDGRFLGVVGISRKVARVRPSMEPPMPIG